MKFFPAIIPLLLICSCHLFGVGIQDMNKGDTGREIDSTLNTVTYSFDYDDFTELVISHAFQVEVVSSSQFLVEVTLSKSIEDQLYVYKNGNTVHIGLNNGFTFGSNIRSAVIHMPEIKGIELSGAAIAELDGRFTSVEHLKIDMSGASQLLGELSTADLDLELSGASIINLTGAAAYGNLDISGASRVHLNGYRIDQSDCEVSGASQIDFHALTSVKLDVSGASVINVHVDSGTLDAEASGASMVHYSGKVDLIGSDTSGASSISRL